MDGLKEFHMKVSRTAQRHFQCLTLAASLALSPLAGATGLSDVYELAVANDPQLAAAMAGYRARAEVVTQSRGGLLPNVSASAQTTKNKRTSPEAVQSPTGGITVFQQTQEFNDNSWSATLSQPVFNLASWFTFQQSKEIEAQAAAQLAAEQQDLIFRVADNYLSILEAQDRLSAAIAERDAVKRQLEQVQQRFDVGLVAITDVLESQAAFDTSTVGVIEAEGAQAITFETLVRLTGELIEKIDGLSEEFPVEYPEPRNEDAWVEAALENNYELAAARHAVEQSRRGLQIARSGHAPTVNANVTYRESVNNASNIFAGTTESTSATLSMNVPIFSGLAQRSRSKQAGFELDQAQKNFDLTQRTVVENTRTLYSAIITDVARVRARLRGIESSQSALDATQTGYEVGTRNIVDVLLAQQRLFAAQFQYASARYQYIRDTLRLKQVVGSLSPEDIYDLDRYIAADQSVEKITPTTR